MAQKRWDIFCKVIDNFGDAGVCWRLARQLVAEHGLAVRLWIDALPRLQPLCPELDPRQSRQYQQQVEIRHWPAAFPVLSPDDMADVVIEAFACELPLGYLQAMAERSKTAAIAWINLEYLSAETWVADCHGLPSPHPRLPLQKFFFFPGFTPDSGGLLRETTLLARRAQWQNQLQPDHAADQRPSYLPAAAPGQLTVSLFAYENPALPALLQAWQTATQPIRCLTPQGQVLEQIARLPGWPTLQAGDVLQRGQLSLHALPFVRQEDYDLLLWSCDLNFVRGEDSFVRALWAGRPLVWQLYPQAEAAHLAKLQAFLELYCTELPASAASDLRHFWQLWNGAAAEDEHCTDNHIKTAWAAYARHLQPPPHDGYFSHARRWCEQQARQPDLAQQLVSFCKKLL